MIDKFKSKNSKEIDLVKYLERIQSKSCLRPADCENKFEKPIWFDENKFNHGKSVGEKYFFGLFTGHLSGLVLLVYNQSILETLLTTGNSKNVPKLFCRYFNTALHIKKWYFGDIWDEQNYAYKSISMVRSIHWKIITARNQNLTTNKDVLNFSQFDMFMTQFAFLGQIIVSSKKFGLNLIDRDLIGLIHFWRCIGYLLGIEDEFNLFSNEDLNFQRKICKLISIKLIKPTIIENKSILSSKMSWSICASIGGIIKLLYANTFLKFVFQSCDLFEEADKINLTKKETYQLKLMNFTFTYLYHFLPIRLFLNYLLKSSFKRTEDNFQLKRKNLAILHKDSEICSKLINEETSIQIDKRTIEEINLN